MRGTVGRTRLLGALAVLLVGGLGVVDYMMASRSYDDHEPSRAPDGVVVREVPDQEKDQEKDLGEYWTEERMRNAEPL